MQKRDTAGEDKHGHQGVKGAGETHREIGNDVSR